MRSGKRLRVGLLTALLLAWRLMAGASQYGDALPAAIIVIIVSILAMTESASVRRAWGWMCVLNGVLSAMLAISSIAARGAPYEPGAGYEQEIARAIRSMPLTEVIPHFAFLGTAIVFDQLMRPKPLPPRLARKN
jgi:hypothetical protein